MTKKTSKKSKPFAKPLLKFLHKELDSTLRLVTKEATSFGDKAMREMCGENTSQSFRRKQQRQRRRVR